jgi:two-component system, OmpR family, sensor histidine kinase CiaH
MFKKTRRRLVFHNAIVFLILLNLFGAMLYFYTQYRLYRTANATIEDMKKDLVADQSDDVGKLISPERAENNRVIYLLWQKGGELGHVVPERGMNPSVAKKFGEAKNKKGIQSITIDSRSYHFVNIPITHDKKYHALQTIQIVYNLEREKEMLSHLLIVFSFGDLFSVFLAVIAGLYLANKAFIPIKKTWDQQQQFVADASHELRTPLSVMKLNLEHLFRHPDHTIEQESETISQVIQEINYMTRMTKDLLTLARSDADQLDMVKTPTRFDHILNQVVKDFKALAQLKDIDLQSEIPTPIEMLGDSERLKQCVVVLLDNALKYTKSQGVITVAANIRNGKAILDITDTGVGIPEEDLPYIFDRYYRGDKSRTRQFEGTGLGLSIAKWIIQSHGGKIRVTSKVGIGTHVQVSFSLKMRG